MTTSNEKITSEPGHPTDEIERQFFADYGEEDLELGTVADRLFHLLQEIAEWKLEAKLEDNRRYFFHVNEVNRIAQGQRSFVIGRKGSGKTAISEYLCRQTTADTFSIKLTFKNFPFNELYELRDASYAAPHQYITLWKFLIYSHVCQLMTRNPAIDTLTHDILNKVYLENQMSLPRRIHRWLDRDFGVEIFGVGMNVGAAPADERRQSLIMRVQKLEDLLLKHVDTSKYLIVFDELDEDYRNVTDEQQLTQYSALITGLFKAVQDVRSVFSRQKAKLYPIIFLRDDIYDIIQDSDKTKWNDLRIDLDWDVDRIRDVIAFRITRALDPDATRALPFADAWGTLFFDGLVKAGKKGKNRTHAFEYILRSTHLRPRDFIQYLKACAEDQLRKSPPNKISASAIKRVDRAFSNYLKSELMDEMYAVIPDISSVLDVISQLKKWLFSVKEFIDAYNRQLKRSSLLERDPTFVLQVLFIFGVIGNQTRGGKHIFRYRNKEARFSFDDLIVVHRGLFKALQIGMD
jgi:hypothetical protein